MSDFDYVIDVINHTAKGKEYFNISDLAKLFNISSETLRKYEKKHIIEPIRYDNTYRVYSSWEITKVIRARQLRSEGNSLLEVDEHLSGIDFSSRLEHIEKREREIVSEIEERQKLLIWLRNKKALLTEYESNKGQIYRKKCSRIYCSIYMVGNTLTGKTDEDLKELQKWMNALPYTSVYYIGISKDKTLSCVGFTEEERIAYHLEDLKPDFIIPEMDYLVFDDFAQHNNDFDTSNECIDRGFQRVHESGEQTNGLFVIRMIDYIQKDGVYSSHNLMMFSIEK